MEKGDLVSRAKGAAEAAGLAIPAVRRGSGWTPQAALKPVGAASASGACVRLTTCTRPLPLPCGVCRDTLSTRSRGTTSARLPGSTSTWRPGRSSTLRTRAGAAALGIACCCCSTKEKLRVGSSPRLRLNSRGIACYNCTGICGTARRTHSSSGSRRRRERHISPLPGATVRVLLQRSARALVQRPTMGRGYFSSAGRHVGRARERHGGVGQRRWRRGGGS